MGKYWGRQGTVKAENKKATPWSCLVQPSKIFKYTGVNIKLTDKAGTKTSDYKLAMNKYRLENRSV